MGLRTSSIDWQNMQNTERISRKAIILLAWLACAAFVAGLLLGAGRNAGLMLLALGATFGFLSLALWIARQFVLAQHRVLIDATTAALANHPNAALLVEVATGRVLWRNASAAALFGDGAQIDGLLADSCAQPASFCQKLVKKSLQTGTATAQLVVGGRDYDLALRTVALGATLWTLQQICESAAPVRLEQVLDWVMLDPSGQITHAAPQLDPHLAALAQGLREATANPAGSLRLLVGSQSRLALPLPQADDNVLVVLLPAMDLSPDIANLEDALALLPVAVALIDDTGSIAYANQDASRLLNLPADGGVQISDRFEGLGRPVSEWIDDVRSQRHGRGTEVLRLARNGMESFVQVSIRPLGPAVHGQMLAVMNDATELKALEAKFTQSQKMQAIGQLAGGVAHDFNNLLTAISGHCELILLRHDRSDVDYPDLMQIQQNTNRAAALVRQLLAFSRKQTLQFETLDLQAALSDLVHLLNRLVGEKISLTLRYADRPIAIRSDRRQLEQVLVNLVVNARDAMPLGGEVVVETSICDLPDGLERDRVTLPPGQYAMIEVRDQGVGIPAANMPKLFEPFFTTKRQGEGTGLGLSTVYGIVKQMGGYIFVDSEEGVGTSVRLYFKPKKIADITARDKPRAVELGAVALKRSLVLLVEDEAPVRSFAARALQLQGHRVLEAESGEAALSLLNDPNLCPDLFVTDVIMPGLDGPGWIAQIRDRHPTTPVVFMSGYAEDGRSAAQARVENSVFLAKPFSLGDFTATVSAQLKRQKDVA
jgi:two-component system, cell cycle sensor histidine kinase and response regulator CckA